MHKAAHYKARSSTTGQVQSRSLLHAEVSGQATLCKEVCWELDSTAEASTDHSSIHTTVHALDTFALVDLAQSIKRVSVIVLGTDGEEGRVRLQACLDKEERRSGCGTDDTRGSTCEDIGSKGLNLGIVIDGRCDVGADWLIEAKTAAVQQDLVDVLKVMIVSLMSGHRIEQHIPTYCRSDAPEQTPRSLILEDNLDAVQDTPILLHALILRLQFTL